LHRKILYKHSNGRGKKLPIKQVSPKSKTIDVDVEIKNFVVTPNEEKVKNPKYLKNLDLKYSKNSQKQKGSKNKERVKQKFFTLNKKTTNQEKPLS
jgi:hypothetical protein